MIFIRYEKCDPEGCDSIRPVVFIRRPRSVSPFVPVIPFLPSPMVFLFFTADHSEARETSIVGRYSTINSALALTRIYRVSCGSVQRTEETSPPHPLYAMSFSVSPWQRAIPLSALPCSSEIYSSLLWLATPPFLPSCDVYVREAEKSTPTIRPRPAVLFRE